MVDDGQRDKMDILVGEDVLGRGKVGPTSQRNHDIERKEEGGRSIDQFTERHHHCNGSRGTFSFGKDQVKWHIRAVGVVIWQN